MKTKINQKKRNVKKKIKRVEKKKKCCTPEQWGEEFESMVRVSPRPPVTFNFIKRSMDDYKLQAGDPFQGRHSFIPDTPANRRSTVDLLRPYQQKFNEREGHITDTLRYMTMPGLSSQASTATVPMTRGELGSAPAHYANGKYTPWEIVDDWKLEYYCGNALKYVCRHKHKGTPVQDIQKAIDCLLKYKANLEKETK